MTREEAIEKIREAMPTLWKETKDAIQIIIPELRESEDKRIINEIIEFIQWSEDRGMTRHDFHQAKRPSEWITWLNKCKESLHISKTCKENADSFTYEDEKIIKRLIDYFKAVGKSWTHRDITGEQILCWLEKQKNLDKMIVVSHEVWDNAISDAYENGKKDGEKQKGEEQKAKERLDRMAPIYNDKESFEAALEKAWKYYNESASRTVDSFEDDYIECVFSKGFREGFLYKEKQKEQKQQLPLMGGDTDTYFGDLRMSTKPLTSREWFDEGIKYAQRLQKEQKLVEPSDDELQRHQDELYDFKVFAAKQAKEHHISFVHDFEWNNFCAELLFYFAEQKPVVWGENDDIPFNNVLYGLQCAHEYLVNHKSYDDAKDVKEAYDWMISRFKYFRPNLQSKPAECGKENEKIRNEILEYFTITRAQDFVANPERQKWISYIEKQKEPKSSIFPPGLGEVHFNPISCVQKPAEWSEKHIADIFEKVGLAKIAREQGNDELTNALQDAMLELSKVENTEWSDEDEDKMDVIIRLITQNSGWPDRAIKEYVDWLKSLRLQPSWKPSEEQMDALGDAYVEANTFKEGDILESLYNDLKKLI